MQIIVKDRITGIQTERSPFGTFGPGNLLDDSSRNAWVSSYKNDRIIVDSNSQVDSVFLGRVRADEGTYTFCDNPRIDVTYDLQSANSVIDLTYMSDHGLVDGDMVNIDCDLFPALNVQSSAITKVTNSVNTVSVTLDGFINKEIHFDGGYGYLHYENHGFIVDNLSTIYTCGLLLDDVYDNQQYSAIGASALPVSAIDSDNLRITLSTVAITSFTYKVSYKNYLKLQLAPTNAETLTVRTISKSTASGSPVLGTADSSAYLGKRPISVRYFDSLSSFVRGVFVQAVNSFIDLPYSSKRSRFILDLETSVNQNEAIVTHWFQESITTTGTKFNVGAFSRGEGYLALYCGGVTLPADWKVHDSLQVTGAENWTLPAPNDDISHTGASLNGNYVIQSLSSSLKLNDFDSLTLPSGFVVILKDRSSKTVIPIQKTFASTPGYPIIFEVQKVLESSGRLCRDPYPAVTLTYDGIAGTASLSFQNAHGLVNNDKIIIYDSGVNGLDGTYLITYYSKSETRITIKNFSQKNLSSISRNTTQNVATVSFSDSHNFYVGDSLQISGATDSGAASGVSAYNSTFTIETVPNTKSITFLSSDSSHANATGGTGSVGVNGNGNTSAGVVLPTNISDNKRIMVGGFVGTVAGYANSVYTPHKNNFLQIMLIKGDGTGKGNIVLNGGVSDTNDLTTLNQPVKIFSIQLPITAGILNAGYSISFPNPQVGLSEGRTDYSVKKVLPTGSYYFLNRVAGKTYSGSIVGTKSQIDDFMAFAEEFLGKPFPVLVLQNMSLEAKTSMYAYMSAMPVMSFSNKLGTLRSASFSFSEVL